MRKGFTLIELIIVVIVIGILAGLALPQFFKVAERGRAAEGLSVLGSIRSSMMRYFTEWGNTTSDLEDLDVEVSSKYFDVENITLGSGIDDWNGSPDSEVANINRTSLNRAGFGEYILSIDCEGDIWCTNGTEGDCKSIGIPDSDPH